jgi:hypothetical protein
MGMVGQISSVGGDGAGRESGRFPATYHMHHHLLR